MCVVSADGTVIYYQITWVVDATADPGAVPCDVNGVEPQASEVDNASTSNLPAGSATGNGYP